MRRLQEEPGAGRACGAGAASPTLTPMGKSEMARMGGVIWTFTDFISKVLGNRRGRRCDEERGSFRRAGQSRERGQS